MFLIDGLRLARLRPTLHTTGGELNCNALRPSQSLRDVLPESAFGARWVRTAVMFLIDGLRLARLRPTLHTLALPNRGWREDPAEEEKRRRLVFGAGGRTCAAPRLRQSLAALGFGYGLNEERRTKNEERRTKNEERRTKNPKDQFRTQSLEG